MSEIEKIYYNFEKLNDDFVDLPETKQASNEVGEIIENMVPSGKLELQDAITGLCALNEKQGFIYGFQYAVALLTCGKRAVD